MGNAVMGRDVGTRSFVQGNGGRYVDMNFIEYTPRGLHGGSRTSSYLLDTAFALLPLDPAWGDVIGRVQSLVGVGNTVWGLKNAGGDCFLECYLYYPQRNPAHRYEPLAEVLQPFAAGSLSGASPGNYECLSFNLDAATISGINVYYIDDYRGAASITAHSWFLGAGQRELLHMNTYHAPLVESGFHADGFHFADATGLIEACCRKCFPGEDPALGRFYKDHEWSGTGGRALAPVGVAEKPGAIGLYFMGLTISQFIAFLQAFDYPREFLGRVRADRDALRHMRYDVGIDFSIAGGRVLVRKTAFFGSV